MVFQQFIGAQLVHKKEVNKTETAAKDDIQNPSGTSLCTLSCCYCLGGSYQPHFPHEENEARTYKLQGLVKC